MPSLLATSWAAGAAGGAPVAPSLAGHVREMEIQPSGYQQLRAQTARTRYPGSRVSEAHSLGTAGGGTGGGAGGGVGSGAAVAVAVAVAGMAVGKTAGMVVGMTAGNQAGPQRALVDRQPRGSSGEPAPYPCHTWKPSACAVWCQEATDQGRGSRALHSYHRGHRVAVRVRGRRRRQR
ncbi:hypothetical protein B0T26DRAFT_322873 [Lasiosphaeria miniovina]|uniref:Uncharacterized protein n=1 Tax=Lasiosphaeria miniovina TaxID=1954250 RepID=A0AA40DVV7_9PEZI|nr:uncharacterized protein B0T26DRAFT_322873 [Lasiosphaeria miniovina]KAK0718264.1 hypothetical protein B0T26DRAFT_322873 [Lasiosphaeria miniovina]